ncbi:DUF6429 family protein [Pseudomonas sp. zbq_5]|uniref:DUF6429 family protein n=1 Tax=unclassified Pseudomonas TaxID=196821 RepID=UPI00370C4537
MLRQKALRSSAPLLIRKRSDKGNAWKGFDFEIMNRLHEQGFISVPVNRKKSIWLTTEEWSEVRS